MSANTRGVAGVGIGDMAQAIGAAMTARILEQRKSLPKASNGATISPTCPRARSVQSEMQGGRSRHCEGVMVALLANQDDGVPAEDVVAPLLFAIEAIYARAAAPRVTRPIPALNAHETRVDFRLDLAQLRLAESPECVEALREVERAAAQYAPVLEELSATVRHRLAVITATPRPVYGARRGELVLHS